MRPVSELVPSAGALAPAPAAYPADRHPAGTYLARLAPSGRRSQRAGLERIARALSDDRLGWEQLPWHLLRYQHAAAVRSWLQERFQVTTARNYLAALRGVLKESWRLGLMSTDDYMRARDLEAIRGEVLPAGRDVSSGELRALFEHLAQDPGPIARRDAAILALLFAAGVRRTEAAGLQLADVDPETGRVIVRGKGRKERTCWLPPSALGAIRDWLQVRGADAGALLLPIRKGGRIEMRPMSAQAVRDACVRRAAQAAVAHFTPHDGRRTWTGDLLDASGDLSVVQGLAGHASPATTARYDRRPDEVRRREAAKLHLPYVPPPQAA
jgi:integrase/recombinase XerD